MSSDWYAHKIMYNFEDQEKDHNLKTRRKTTKDYGILGWMVVRGPGGRLNSYQQLKDQEEG